MRKPPERTCIGCRTVCPASELVCLIAPEGQVRLARCGPVQSEADPPGRKRGRGAWVHARCLPAAAKAMGRAFRRQVEIPKVDTLLAQMHVASGRSINAQGDSR
jgi:predicted RNA-binding protein YlxR (DUF448 family)